MADDEIIITPWRHDKEKGAIGLDIGVHFTDLSPGTFFVRSTRCFGEGFIAGTGSLSPARIPR